MSLKLSYYVKPCDRPRGRPRHAVAGYVSKWRKPYREIGDDPLGAIGPDLVDYLNRAGSSSGWFTISVHGSMLGTIASIRVRRFDVLVQAGSIFGAPNKCFLACDGAGEPCLRAFVPMIGPAPRQRMHVRRIRDASNFREAVNG